MNDSPRNAHPLLYQIHTRDWLARFPIGDRASYLNEIPDEELDRIAAFGFDWLWLLGVWQTGAAAAKISRTNPEWRREYQEALPGFREQDITGSTFAIDAYQVHQDFGGKEALALLRGRLAAKGVRLLLDFVPNHTAPDHPWVQTHPEYYVPGNEADLAQEPNNYVRLQTKEGERIFARGRDPYFAAWPDTLQLNYGSLALQAAMTGELQEIAGQCDGVRCDMAMLILPEIFKRTWGIEAGPFWPHAIAVVRNAHSGFLFMAEVYWGLDRQLQALGFDYTYDKPLYDLLLQKDAMGVRAHLNTDRSFVGKSVHFLENHDEQRIAAQLPLPIHQAAAALTFLLPGVRLFHDGQLEGFLHKPSIHLARRISEPIDQAVHTFYLRLLQILKSQAVSGDWMLLDVRTAWQDNPSNASIIAFGWKRNSRLEALLAVNYSDHQSQGYIDFPAGTWTDPGSVTLANLFGAERYERSQQDLQSKGMYLDVSAWSSQLFQVLPAVTN